MLTGQNEQPPELHDNGVLDAEGQAAIEKLVAEYYTAKRGNR